MKTAVSILSIAAVLLGAASLQLHGRVVLNETFDYADGALTTVANAQWQNHSGTAGQVDVGAAAVNLTEAEGEDVDAPLGGGPFAVDGGTVLYAKFTVRFSALPSGTGTYFAHFKDSGTGFRAKVFASTTGAAEGRLRLGISEAGNTPVLLETDLTLDTPYVVVVRCEVGTAASRLWLNPTAETDAGIDASDDGTAAAIAGFALRQSLSSGNGMGTLTVDDLRVATSFAELSGVVEDQAPSIVTHPQSQSVAAGGPANFSVIASGTAPLSFQWQRSQTNLPGAVSQSLTLNPVAASDAGAYRVIVSNSLGTATSDEATLTVTNAAPTSVATNIAYLHTLLDPVNFTATDKTTLFTVEGIVTTWTNLTSATSGLFNIQDDTGGIAVFHGGAAGVVPAAGARVRVTAPLTEYNGLLELGPVASNPSHEVVTLSIENPLPSPRLTSPSELAALTAAEIEAEWEGRVITFTNLTISTPPDLTKFVGNATVTVTDAGGYPFALFINLYSDIGGQSVPPGEFSVVGVFGQFDNNGDPRDSSYQIIPSRYADIISPNKAPTVRFTNLLEHLVRPGDLPTNTFAEIGLRAGEKLTIRISVTDPLGGSVTVEPAATGLPTQGEWSFPKLSGAQVDGTFTMTAQAADRGTLFDVTLVARNGTADNTAVWRVYVPTEAEERVAIAEYLANPTGTADAPHYNPLRRDPATDNPGQHDEYLELVNLSGADVDLSGWSVADGVSLRHKFYDPFLLASKNAILIYGGPLNGLLPVLDIPTIPASESSAGLALNNDGDTVIVRNQLGGVVERLVYTSRMVSSGGSMTRFPTIDHSFAAQTNVATLAVTPGRQYDGKLWSEAPTIPVTDVGAIAASLNSDGSVKLTWQAAAGQSYSVRSAAAVVGPWNVLASGLTQGEYTDTPPAGSLTRFYRVSAP